MNDPFPFDPEQREVFRVELVCHVWLLMEAIHYDESSVKENAKITLPALHWFLDGLYLLTLEELMLLRSLLVPMPKYKRISGMDIRISALLSKLSVINSENNFGTSQSQNFKNVEPFISMLSSGVFPIPLLKKKDIPDWWRDFGDTDT